MILVAFLVEAITEVKVGKGKTCASANGCALDYSSIGNWRARITVNTDETGMSV